MMWLLQYLQPPPVDLIKRCRRCSILDDDDDVGFYNHLSHPHPRPTLTRPDVVAHKRSRSSCEWYWLDLHELIGPVRWLFQVSPVN